MKISRISKIAGASLLGFCAVSLGVDKANLGPAASQAAGFVGAFLGSIAAQRRQLKKRANTDPRAKTATPTTAKPTTPKPKTAEPKAARNTAQVPPE